MADLSENTIAKRVYQRLAGKVPGINTARIIERIVEARNLFALEIAESPSREERRLFWGTFTVSGSEGVFDLTATKALTEPLLVQTISRAIITHPSSDFPLQYLPDRSAASLDRSMEFIYYWIEGNSLCTLNTDGEINTLEDTLTIRGNKVPSLSTISRQPPLKERFVDMLTKICENVPQEAVAT